MFTKELYRMNNYFGVMQGRLLPKYKGRYQAHPKNYWSEEFFIAKELKLDCIEFIFDFDGFSENPLFTILGVNSIKEVIAKTGVKVVSVCADYFMERPIHNKKKSMRKDSLDMMKRLIDNTSLLGVKDIVLPCVDNSSLINSESYNNFEEEIFNLSRLFDNYEINLSLETDLPPKNFKDLLIKINSKNIKVNYDIGNSSSLGYLVEDELNAYGEYISDIHIKDRMLRGGPVELGKGNSNFEKFFYLLEKFNYQGPFIMQAYRDEEGIEIFKKQKKFIQPYLSKFNN